MPRPASGVWTKRTKGLDKAGQTPGQSTELLHFQHGIDSVLLSTDSVLLVIDSLLFNTDSVLLGTAYLLLGADSALSITQY